jgi:Flp pilus assembly protein TadG
VRGAPGAEFDLANPQNRVRASLWPANAGTVTVTGNEVTVTTSRHGVARLTITYQRQLADGSYRDVANTRRHHGAPVAVTVPVISR